MYPNPQEVLPLPPNPSLDQYKKLAKDLVKAYKSTETDATLAWARRWLETLARLHNLNISQRRARIDHEAGKLERFAKSKLANSSAALTGGQFVIARVHGFLSWPKFVKHLAALTASDSPTRRFEAAVDAIIDGDISTLARLLREDPELICARSTREHGATLLHYVAANGVENYRQKTPQNVVAIAKLLLAAGADVDAGAQLYGDGDSTLELAATSVRPERAGVQRELLETLLQHGATIDAGAGSTVLACLHNDRPQAAELLAARGAHLDLESAAGVGRLDTVKRYFDDEGGLRPISVESGGDRLSPACGATQHQLQAGFIWACEYGHHEVVRFLLEKGIELRFGENTGETALHLAAHRGQLQIINILLARGAPLEAKNVYGGTVLGQATWSVMNGDPTIDFVPTIEALLAAGASIEAADYPTGNARVDEILRRHGAK